METEATNWTITDILDMMSMIDAKLALKKEVAALEQQQQKSKGSQQSNNKGKSNNGGESKWEKRMPCRKHDGEHDWRDCPENKNRRPQSESKKEKDGRTRTFMNPEEQTPCRAPRRKAARVFSGASRPAPRWAIQRG